MTTPKTNGDIENSPDVIYKERQFEVTVDINSYPVTTSIETTLNNHLSKVGITITYISLQHEDKTKIDYKFDCRLKRKYVQGIITGALIALGYVNEI
tara:strand:+ start:38293 stop:38583 length:291 start_codon:yes stop_codon:yes gene_type:complete